MGNFVHRHWPFIALGIAVAVITSLQLTQERNSLTAQVVNGHCARMDCASCSCDLTDNQCFTDLDECLVANNQGSCQFEVPSGGTCPFDEGNEMVCYAPEGTACTSNTQCPDTGTCGGAGGCNCDIYGWYDEDPEPDSTSCVFDASCNTSITDCYAKKSECEAGGGGSGGSGPKTWHCEGGTCEQQADCEQNQTMTCFATQQECQNSQECSSNNNNGGSGGEPKWCCGTTGGACTQLPSVGETCANGSSYDTKQTCEAQTICGEESNDGDQCCVGGGCQGGFDSVGCTAAGHTWYDSEFSCNNQCGGSSTPVCGDGTKEGSEECDDGNTNNNDGCSSNCKNEVCGDGIKQTFEECDDGNSVNTDGCVSNTCNAARCGDGFVQTGVEECDDGNQDDSDSCKNDCTAGSNAPVCGDGTKEGSEECDDGNTNSNDGCSASCATESCGDGVEQTSEECDDGNSNNNDGCSSSCKDEVCGDGIKQDSEECDDGNQDDIDSCKNDCTEPQVAASSAQSSAESSEAESSAVVSSEASSEAQSSAESSEAESSAVVSSEASSEAQSSAESSEAESSAVVSSEASSEAQSSAESSAIAISDPASSVSSQFVDVDTCGNDPDICCISGAKQYCCQGKSGGKFNRTTVCWDSKEEPPQEICDAVDPAFTCSACTTDADCHSNELCFDGTCSLYDYAENWEKANKPDVFSTAVGHSLIKVQTGNTQTFWNVFQETNPVFSNTNVASGDGVNWAEESGQFVGTPSIAEFTHVVFNDLHWLIGGTDYSRAPRKTRDVWNSEDGIEWSKYPNALPVAVDRHASVVFNNRLWIFGGAQGVEDYGDRIFVSPTGISGWTEAGTIPAPLIHAEAVVWNGEILIIGGQLQNGTDSRKVWRSTDGVNWSEVGSNALSGLNFSNRTATVFGNRIWLAGRSTDDSVPVHFSEDGGATWKPYASPETHVFGGTDMEGLNQVLWLVGAYDDQSASNADDVYYLATVPRNTCNPNEFDDRFFCPTESSSSSSSFDPIPPRSSVSSVAVSSAEASVSSFDFSIASVPTSATSSAQNSAEAVSSQAPTPIVCGDGVVQGREQCDDGNNRNRDGCSSGCEIEPDRTSEPASEPAFQPIPVGRETACGNGIVEGNEKCDDGNVRDNDGCSSTCTVEPTLLLPTDPICGNGITEQGEACDLGDGNSDVNPNTCRTNCSFPSCGDFVFDQGEECDNGPANSDTKANACRTTCELPRCGDGVVDTDEQCDDGNSQDGDGCSSSCQLQEVRVASVAICGDGIISAGEECDDGNTRENDGCSEACLLQVGFCGDGIVQSLKGEQCEQSTHDPSLPYGCEECQLVLKFCGDGEIQAGEECDDGLLNSDAPGARCRTRCIFGMCGDNVLDPGEECDDGNRISGDDCSSNCREETRVLAGVVSSEPTQPTLASAPEPELPLMPTSISFPGMPTMQPIAPQLPLAQLQPLIQAQGPVGDTGPAAVAVIGAGAAAGFSFVRRKRK